MEPINTNSSQFQMYLDASENFLIQRNFQACRKFAIKATEIDPKHSSASQILAIAQVLVHSNTLNEHPNFYSVLGLPNYSCDQQLMLTNFKIVTSLLNPNVNQYPFAFEAFRVVLRAWSVLSNPIEKAGFDDGLRKGEKDGRVGNSTRFGDGLKSRSFSNPTQKTRFDGGLRSGSSWDPTQKTSFDGGFRSGSFWDPTQKTGFNGGFRSGSFWDPTQKTSFDGGLKSGSFWDPTQKTRFDGGLNTMENGGSFFNPTQKTSFNDGLKSGSFSNPTQKTHFDNGLKINEKDGSFYDPTRRTRLDTFWTMCPYCYYVYEFFKDYEDCSLRCQNEKCKRVLHALPIVGPPPPPEVAEKGEYYCFGFSVLGTEGKSLWSPFVMNKKNDVEEFIEFCDDEVEEDENGEKEEPLGVEEELLKSNGKEVDKGSASSKKKRTKMMAKSSNKVLGKGNKVNMNEIVYNVEGNDDFDFGNVGGEKTNEKNNVEFFVGDDDDIYVNLQDDFDMGAQDIGTLFF